MSCGYCTEDRDGYVFQIPRYMKNIGMRAFISRESITGSSVLNVSGKNRNRCKFEIKYCPMCGRKLT